MESFLSNYSLSDILMYGIFIGFIFSMINDLIMSLTNYLSEKAWRVNDYEELIYKMCTIQLRNEDFSLAWHLHRYGNLNDDDFIMLQDITKNYQKKLQKRKNLDKFLNKFRRDKKDV